MNTCAGDSQHGPSILPNLWRARLEDQQGAIAIIVAVLMVAILTVVALVVDLGGLYDHDRELQTAADAAALAGAQELILTNGDLGSARTKTTDYAIDNTAPKSSVERDHMTFTTLDVEETYVRVGLREDQVPFFFAPIIGETEGSVVAHAKAEVKYLTSVETLFPVALLIMNPEKFRFVFHQKSGGEIGHFDITDEDGDGIYGEDGEGGGQLPPVPSGLYSVDVQTVSTVEGEEEAETLLADAGYWWVSDPSNPEELIYRVGMSRQVGGGTLAVKVEVAPTVEAGSLQARLGGVDFTLNRESGNTFVAYSVPVPPGADNDGYVAYPLVVTIPDPDDGKGGGKDKPGGGGGHSTNVTCARYVAFHPDVPITYLMMEPSFYAGYSREIGEQAFQRAVIVTRIPHMWDEYVMRLGSHTGAGLYSGNWRLADIFANVTTADEISEVDPGVLSEWELNTPLYIDGPLWPETGNKIGQTIKHGLDARKDNWLDLYPGDPDGWRYVIVPFVDYNPDLHGTSEKYVIRMFAAFRIDSYVSHGDDKGEITGQFIRRVAPGEWSDHPSGPLYVETAVLTE